jgi:hypothetical protein
VRFIAARPYLPYILAIVVTYVNGIIAQKADRFVEFSEEMRGKLADAGSRFGGPCEDDVEQEPGIDTYPAINQSLEDSAKNFDYFWYRPRVSAPAIG